jgi:DNA-directed RNA polymerases I, II, and III subunit RPABC5
MIIPIKCFTCGKVIGDKYTYYCEKVAERKIKLNQKPDQPSVIDVNEDDVKKTPEGEVMDELGLIRYCCRKIFLTHIPLIDEL